MDEQKLLYAESHEWLHVDGQTATIGITKFAVEQLNDLVFVELPAIGKQVKKGQSLGIIESVKTVSDIYAPVDGTVVESNNTVAHDPSILSADPYVNGWLVS